MTIEVEFWNLVLLLVAFFGCVAAFGKILLGQIDRRLDERFTAQEKAREEGARAFRATLDGHMADEVLTAARITTVEMATNRELHSIGERISRVEVALQHGFGRPDVEKIYERINEVAEDLAGLKGESRSVADSLRLLVNKITEKGLK